MQVEVQGVSARGVGGGVGGGVLMSGSWGCSGGCSARWRVAKGVWGSARMIGHGFLHLVESSTLYLGWSVCGGWTVARDGWEVVALAGVWRRAFGVVQG